MLKDIYSKTSTFKLMIVMCLLATSCGTRLTAPPTPGSGELKSTEGSSAQADGNQYAIGSTSGAAFGPFSDIATAKTCYEKLTSSCTNEGVFSKPIFGTIPSSKKTSGGSTTIKCTCSNLKNTTTSVAWSKKCTWSGNNPNCS